jgi:hypothetical protein
MCSWNWKPTEYELISFTVVNMKNGDYHKTSAFNTTGEFWWANGVEVIRYS